MALEGQSLEKTVADSNMSAGEQFVTCLHQLAALFLAVSDMVGRFEARRLLHLVNKLLKCCSVVDLLLLGLDVLVRSLGF